MKYGEQYRPVFGCWLFLKVWADEDNSPCKLFSPVTSLCPEANKGFDFAVLIVTEF